MEPPFPLRLFRHLTSSSLALTSAICCCKDRTYSCSVLLDKTLQQPSQLSYLLTVLHCRAVSLFLSSLEFFIQSERSQSLLFYSQVISNDRQTDSRELRYIQTNVCTSWSRAYTHSKPTRRHSQMQHTFLSPFWQTLLPIDLKVKGGKQTCCLNSPFPFSWSALSTPPGLHADSAATLLPSTPDSLSSNVHATFPRPTIASLYYHTFQALCYSHTQYTPSYLALSSVFSNDQLYQQKMKQHINSFHNMHNFSTYVSCV